MKTQLIQDFDESGSAPAVPAVPSAPAAASVGRAAEPAMAPATEPAPAPITGPVIEAATEPATEPAPEPVTDPATEPRPTFQQRPQPPGLAVPHGQDTTVPDPAVPPAARRTAGARDTTDVNDNPEWLAALLARDAEELSESQSRSSRRRRLLGWGAASVVLVLLAAGGLWLYQDSRVEGALVVVANTSPPPAPSAGTGLARVRAPAVTITPVAAASSVTPPEAPATGAETKEALPPDPVPDQQPKPRRTHIRKQPKAEARAAIPADREPSARQRQEETLMQCRAHGYDEDQCQERGCEMTRYGFACKG